MGTSSDHEIAFVADRLAVGAPLPNSARTMFTTEIVHGRQLPPIVQDDELVFDGPVSCEQVRDGGDDTARRQIASRVVIVANDQDTRMSAAGLKDKIVEFCKVIVIGRQERAIRANRIAEIGGIGATDESNIRWHFDVVTSASE